VSRVGSLAKVEDELRGTARANVDVDSYRSAALVAYAHAVLLAEGDARLNAWLPRLPWDVSTRLTPHAAEIAGILAQGVP
jgi:hypothetical protein